MQFLVQDDAQLAQRQVIHRCGRWHVFHRLFANASPARLCSRFQRQSISDAVQPTAERLMFAYGVGLARQHQKRRLERVFRVLLMTQHAATHRQNHAAVPPHDGGKCRVVALGQELLQ
jgi:hypothetical protein